MAGGGHTCPHGHVKHAPAGKRTRADFEQVALRPRHSPYPMLPVEKAMEIILRQVTVMPVTTASNLQDALGCIIAEDIHAQQPLPPFPASVKDGYAVISMLFSVLLWRRTNLLKHFGFVQRASPSLH